MKLFRMLGRSIRDAVKSVVRNFSLSLASISCITITLIIVAVAIMASYNVQNFTKEIERDMTIVAFLDNDVTSEDVEDTYRTMLRRIDKLGVSEPELTIEGKDKIRVKLAGVTDPEAARIVTSIVTTIVIFIL